MLWNEIHTHFLERYEMLDLSNLKLKKIERRWVELISIYNLNICINFQMLHHDMIISTVKKMAWILSLNSLQTLVALGLSPKRIRQVLSYSITLGTSLPLHLWRTQPRKYPLSCVPVLGECWQCPEGNILNTFSPEVLYDNRVM